MKWILSTEPHYDHAAGLAALVRDTGATVLAGVAAVPALRVGHSGPEDPQMTSLTAYPPIARVRGVRDGERITLGDVTVTAVATPGHTPGSTSWAWESCAHDECRPVLFAASLNPLASGTYRFTAPAHRDALTAFRQSFARVRARRCGILLTPHPEQSGGDVKLVRLRAGDATAFVDVGACKRLADTFEALLDQRLTAETTGGVTQ